MPHHIYTTRAFVVSSRTTGEANRSFSLFTEELGMIQASAQGVRHEKSKLRYSLQNYQYILVSLVRGRESWRIVGAEELRDLPPLNQSQLEAAARIYGFLLQLIHGEGRIEQLFLDLEAIWQLWSRLVSNSARRHLEILLRLRALHYLGYLDPRPKVVEGLVGGEITPQMLDDLAARQEEVLSIIEQSMMGSQL
jgi:recombinational DNA repair protein (RecF pathway)